MANRTVTVSWSFVHTGGLPLTNVSVSYYYIFLSPIPIPLISVGTTLVTIPDLKAGFEYTFNVTAVNSEGSSSTVCGLTIPESGDLYNFVYINLCLYQHLIHNMATIVYTQTDIHKIDFDTCNKLQK